MSLVPTVMWVAATAWLTAQAPVPANVPRLNVTSTAFRPNAPIAVKYSHYGENVSPDVAWSGAPAAARTFVILLDDPDAMAPRPFTHWILYNLPSTVHALPESIPSTPRLPEFGGALQGRTSRGTSGYFGPRPPRGDPPHQYHLQVFALDAPLALEAGAAAADVRAAMQGHVVAAGEFVSTFEMPGDAGRRTP